MIVYEGMLTTIGCLLSGWGLFTQQGMGMGCKYINNHLNRIILRLLLLPQFSNEDALGSRGYTE